MVGTQKMIHTAAGYLKYKSYMPGTQKMIHTVAGYLKHKSYMSGTQKMIHTAAGYLKYKSYMPGTLEISLASAKLIQNARQFKKSIVSYDMVQYSSEAYLELYQISKTELFGEKVSRYKPLTAFVEKLHLGCLTELLIRL